VTPDIDLTGAELAQTSALSCQYLAAKQLRLPRAPVQGAVDLSNARLDTLEADPEATPSGIQADGLTYAALVPSLPAGKRVEWLNRCAGYRPQPYGQLAASYRRQGQDDQARTVLLAREREKRRTASAPIRLWGLLQDITIGYGYRPLLAAVWLAGLLAVGTTTFALHPPPPTSTSGPEFNPFVYTVDLMLPILTYGQRAAFAPTGGYQWLSYGLTTLGWLLATTTAAGVTRALSRN
jgi:hypothetical protein